MQGRYVGKRARIHATTVHTRADVMIVQGTGRGFCEKEPAKEKSAIENLQRENLRWGIMLKTTDGKRLNVG